MSQTIVAKKSLGQHWLNDETALVAMCQAAQVGPEDTVLEIGPGLGTLTKYLVRSARHVIAVEFDPILANSLHDKSEDKSKLTVIKMDILKFDFSDLPPKYKVVANIPYYLTGHLLRLLSETPNPPDKVALLVQKEVAERVVAIEGNMSNLSVATQYYWEASTGLVVPARLFTPPPKVDSQILILNRRTRPLFPNTDDKQFFRVVKAGFSARRKTLGNSLAGGLRLKKEDVRQLLEIAGIDQNVRAQELSLNHWQQIYQALNASPL